MDEIAMRQLELRADLDLVTAYGERFPATWTGVRYDGPRLVALFTDPDQHRAALTALVQHPHALTVQAYWR